MPDCGVHLRYRFTDTLDDAALADMAACLSPEERTRADRFVFRDDRRDFLAAHALARMALSAHHPTPPAAWTFTANAFGKPAVSSGGPPRAVNLTHTRGLVAVAVGENDDVGVDAEAIDRQVAPLELAGRFFAPSEVRDLRACSEQGRAIRFLELWTLKEAYIKAVGLGLSTPLDQFAFAFDEPATLRFQPPPGQSRDAWRFALFAPSDRTRLAVATRTAPGARCVVYVHPPGEGARAALLRCSADVHATDAPAHPELGCGLPHRPRGVAPE